MRSTACYTRNISGLREPFRHTKACYRIGKALSTLSDDKMQFDTFCNSPALHENKKRVNQEGHRLTPLPEIQEVPEMADRGNVWGWR